jgi:hypothetical protein
MHQFQLREELSHAQVFGGFEWRAAFAADDGAAIAADERVKDFGGAFRAVEQFWLWACFGGHQV